MKVTPVSSLSRVERKLGIQPQFRWCTHRKHMQPVEGGKWLITNAGKNRRWVCAGCLLNINQRGKTA